VNKFRQKEFELTCRSTSINSSSTSATLGNEHVDNENIEAVIKVLISTWPFGRRTVDRSRSRSSNGSFSCDKWKML